MTSQMPALTPRQRFLKARQRRQALTFAMTGAILAVVAIVSALVLAGIVPVPIGNEFSRAVKYAAPGDVPCPTSTALVDPAGIRVQILNATSRPGLASDATTMLSTAGYTPLEPGNTVSEYPGKVEIDVGPNAVDAAYTVARFFPGSKVVLTESTDATVTVLLGNFYDGPLSADDVQRIIDSRDPIRAPKNCVAVNTDDEGDAEQSAQSGEQSGAEAEGVESEEPTDAQSAE